MTRRDSLVTITIPTAISGISRAQNKRFYRSTRLTPPINLIDTGQGPAPDPQATMLRAHHLQQDYTLSDPEMEEALMEGSAMRGF